MERTLGSAAKETDIVAFEWSKAIETGRADIDQEHRKIIDFLNELRQAVYQPAADNRLSGTLLGLKEYVDLHFAHEEEIMNGFDYDERDLHLAAHAQFYRRVTAINDEHLGNPETAKALMLYVYDWLINHITTIDRRMIRKVSGDSQAGSEDDPNKLQVSRVIDGAYETVTQIETMTLELALADGKTKEKLQNRVTEASNRLINLMTLASDHLRREDDAGFNRDRLNGLKSGLMTSAKVLIEHKALKLIHYGTRIANQIPGTPFGCGAIVTTTMNQIFGLVDMMGGVNALSPEQKETVAKAAFISDDVRELEAGTYKLPSFESGTDGAPRTFARAFAKRAASQQDVLKMAQEARKTEPGT